MAAPHRNGSLRRVGSAFFGSRPSRRRKRGHSCGYTGYLAHEPLESRRTGPTFAISAALLLLAALLAFGRRWLGGPPSFEASNVDLTSPVAPLQVDSGGAAASAEEADLPARATRACRVEGRCVRAADGKLVASIATDCEESFECLHNGKCTLENARCVFGPEGCARSIPCRRRGVCTYDPQSEHCEVEGAADCRRSETCSKEGLRCQFDAENGRCFGGTNEACRRSVACRTHGECKLAEKGLGCAVADDAGCRASEACKLWGHCAVFGGSCAPREVAHCSASAGCKDLGICRFERDEEGALPWCAGPLAEFTAVSVTAGPDDASSTVGIVPRNLPTTAHWADFARLQIGMRGADVRGILGPPSRIVVPRVTGDEPECEAHPDGFVFRDLCPVVHEYAHDAGPPTRLTFSRRGLLLRMADVPHGFIEPIGP